MSYINTLTVRTNASQGTSVLVRDLGVVFLASASTPVLFDEYEEVFNSAKSEDLRSFMVDNAHGAGSSTIQVSHDGGITWLSNEDGVAYLNSILAASHSEVNHSVFSSVKTNEDGEIVADLVTNASTPSSLTNWKLGSDLDADGNVITGLAAGVNPSDSVNKAQLDALAAGGKVWKELLLDCDGQLLGGGSGGIKSSIPFWLQNQPSVNDTLTINSTSNSAETYTFRASRSGAFDVAIGSDVDETLQNLVNAIDDDSSGWEAKLLVSMQSLNDGTGSVTAGLVVMISEVAASTTTDSRIYGSLSGIPSYVNLAGETDYSRNVVTNGGSFPSSDPGVKQFGIGRSFADLVVNETHSCRETDTVRTWNNDQNQWENTGANSIQAGLGLTKTGEVIDVDFGVGIVSLGDVNGAGVQNEVARVDHIHSHGNRGSDSAGSQHDADQVDVEGTYTRISAPGSSESVFGAINTALGNPLYVGKILEYNQTQRVPESGTLYLRNGNMLSSSVGKRMIRGGSISGASVQKIENTDTNTYNLEVERSTDNGSTWSVVATLSVASSSWGTHGVPTGSLAYSAGDLLRARLVRNTGSGASASNSFDVTIEFNEG